MSESVEGSRAVNHVVDVRGLAVRYPDGRTVTLSGLPFTVGVSERVALIGPNGSGKSTLLRAILGLVRPSAGTVRVLGRDPARDFEEIRPCVGAVLQDVDAQLLAPTVREDLAFGLDSRVVPAAEIRRRVERTAMSFRLDGLLDKVPHYLSGGEKRKVALAGALVTGPDLVVLDEPFAGLDPRARDELTAMLREAHARRGMAVVLATHEVDELADLVDTVYVLTQDGEVRLRETPERVFQLPEVLEASNVPVPALARLQAALRERGVRLPPVSDPEALAAALASLIRGAEEGREAPAPRSAAVPS